MGDEKLQLLVDAVGLGEPDGTKADKKNTMTSSYTGGHRYMTENFHGVVAASRGQASPDIFTIFTCDPKWPEIAENLEPRHKVVDTAYIIIRVYHMKLLEYLQKIKTGKVFGTVVAGTVPVVHTVELQKSGLPHAHILVWQKKDSDEGYRYYCKDRFIIKQAVVDRRFGMSLHVWYPEMLLGPSRKLISISMIPIVLSMIYPCLLPSISTDVFIHVDLYIEARCLGPHYFRPRC